MGIELTPAFWSGLLQIIIVNIVLSGDNALVIALACRNLEKRHQKPAILIGSAGAIVLRIIFVLIVDQLLKIGYLKLIGGLLLLWIGVKLVVEEEEAADIKAHENVWAAVWTIIVADAVMSLDNAIAIAAAAQGDFTLIVLGLVISIPIIIVGATLISKMLDRFPWLGLIGAALHAVVSRAAHRVDQAQVQLAGDDGGRHQPTAGDRHEPLERPEIGQPPGQRARVAVQLRPRHGKHLVVAGSDCHAAILSRPSDSTRCTDRKGGYGAAALGEI